MSAREQERKSALRVAANVKGKCIGACLHGAALVPSKGSGEGDLNSSSHPEHPTEHLCMTSALPFRMLVPNH